MQTSSTKPAATYDAWLDQHSEDLAASRKKSFESSSGIPVETLYTPEHLKREGWDYQRDTGFPGQAPWTRGFTPGGYRKQLWKTEMYAGFGSAEEANERYRYLMSQGSTGGISIALDLPTQIGYDSDHAMARDEVGQIGVALTSLDDVERVFDGIPLDKVGHIFSTANAIGPIVCAWLLALYEKRGTPTGDCIVQLQNDPIKEYVARGTQFLPIEAAVKLTTDMIQHCRTAAPEWLPISVSGSHMKQAGATCVQEAAFTICNGITYVESCLARGMKIDDFGHVLELHFCTEMDFFEEVAKYRAVRKVWTRLVRERFGGTTERAQHFRLHAATSGRPSRRSSRSTISRASRCRRWRRSWVVASRPVPPLSTRRWGSRRRKRRAPPSAPTRSLPMKAAYPIRSTRWAAPTTWSTSRWNTSGASTPSSARSMPWAARWRRYATGSTSARCLKALTAKPAR